AQKGYRFYDPKSCRSFTSPDVTSFESTANYSTKSSPAIPATSLPLPDHALSIPTYRKTYTTITR
ncbi:UNVERIFIED_CONTAM: hypothetical protein Sindi_1485900, partial [Sesamum indicum]